MDLIGDPLELDDPAAVLAALTRWDELEPEALERLATDPVHGPRLATLQQAEGWLRNQASAHRGAPVTDCPAAEELYDYGRGPGYTPLAEQRRTSIDRHLRHCLDCELLVESLAQRPPLPLEVEPLVEGNEREASSSEPAPAGGVVPVKPMQPGRGRLLRWRRLVPALAAASLLALLPLWIGQGRSAEAGGSGLPAAPLLRGELRDPLLFPRERLLAAPRSLALPAWLDLAALRRFEIEPVDGADEYRVELFGHFGGAFDAGRRLARRTGNAPVTSVASVLVSPLPVGHYTWEAWAVVQGLDRRLGARDFEVVQDERLWRELVEDLGGARAARPAVPGLERAVRRLHAAGFLSDARALARELPESAERDEYLGRQPGR